MKQLLLLLAFFLAVQTARSQNSMQPDPIFDLNVALGFPVAEYQESGDFGIGFDLGLYFPISKRVPSLKVGPQFMMLFTGSNTERINEQIEVTLNGQIIDVINLPLRIETNNTTIGGGAVFRANAPVSKYVEPYVQGLIGFRRFATTIRIYDESDEGFFHPDEDGEITHSTPLQDWVFSYGAGAGLQIRLTDNVFLNMSANYLFGGEADYYTKRDIKNFQFNFVGNTTNFDPDNLNSDDLELDARPSRSKTPMIQGNIGVTVLLNDTAPTSQVGACHVLQHETPAKTTVPEHRQGWRMSRWL